VPPGQDDAAVLSAIESLLLIAGGPISLSRLSNVLEEPRQRLDAFLDEVQERLPPGIRLQRMGDEAQLVTAPENVELVHAFLGSAKAPALSRAALETLTVIAYRQPVTRPEIEVVRGVNSDRAVQTLLARGLVEERGQRPVLGRPMEYCTSFGFLEYFGLQSLDELPPLPDHKDHEKADARNLGFRDSKEFDSER
jgi:segregation and condensation protein B